mgnify:CR=1 FL=1
MQNEAGKTMPILHHKNQRNYLHQIVIAYQKLHIFDNVKSYLQVAAKCATLKMNKRLKLNTKINLSKYCQLLFFYDYFINLEYIQTKI